jgi:two-component system sensor histidine kinase PhoQ
MKTRVGPNKKGSLRHRLLLLLMLLPLCLVLTGVVVSLAFKSAQHAANEKRMTASAYALMGIVEPIGAELVFPSQMPEPEFNAPQGDWVAVARDLQGKVLWSAPWAKDVVALPAPQLPPVPDKEIFEYFRADSLQWPLQGKVRHYNLLRARVSYEVFRSGNSGSSERLLIPVVFEIWQNTALLNNPRTSFLLVLWSGLGLMSLLLGVTLWGIIRWILKPLSSVVSELQQMQTGESNRFNASYPLEIQHLTDALNNVLAVERQRREQFRLRLSDLAHSLKTPLAVLKGDMEKMASPDKADWMRQIDVMDQLVGYHLKRAVSGAGVWQQPELLKPLVERLLATLQKVYADRPVQVTNSLPAGLMLNLEQTDLMEIFGNLLDNAFKYGKGKLLIGLNGAGSRPSGLMTITIADNGPGIAADKRSQVLARGQRLDSQEPGQGIGLSIVAELVLAYGGGLVLDASEWGGLLVSVTLPGSFDTGSDGAGVSPGGLPQAARYSR